MTIIVKKETSKKEITTILRQFKKKVPEKNLRSVYGIFPIQGDAVVIQKAFRNEWD